ncbi:MAG: Phospholipid/glycerol acyltransferase [Moraxellaceae bacterium]|nr:Phospholipid/glycerol acyltransferase [Moraxellaceae bacterium]
MPAPLIALIFLTLLGVNTIVFSLLIIVLMPLRFVMPAHRLRVGITALLIALASTWCQINHRVLFRLLPRIEWDITLPEGLGKSNWYFVIANHQSWVDIFVLFFTFTGRIPFLKYFLKQELLYVPFWGQAMYALDFPFMKRYSKETLAAHPELKGKDTETTRRSCEKFRDTPVSVMNFLEGTRFTPQKHAQQQSPYRHLLKPKAGGMAFTLSALGAQMHSLLDVTIVYPDGNPTFMDFACGRLRRVIVRVHRREIPPEAFTRDYETDMEFRESFQTWTAALWNRKDAEITRLLGKEEQQC